ncbi:Flagellar hook-basal body complex protein FliE [Anoxybacillus thermarum]|uniref:Flagellar hook-basal body complex protein FliE n=1 Tax=Anoxybacillus thermarum TaxID=404937 RepID=A0A0D0S2Q5_9BACL|nr:MULTISPECIES: flagellar hook-basal body complex protein FliE [Anoxybacillus]KIQ95261.1 Flagellar hook-basal body complex protein FliE [Anoxybacillus thermarum]MCQ5363751.1 flagellar hook-basal body complex protein FliE [Anoxybacillus gonensis]
MIDRIQRTLPSAVQQQAIKPAEAQRAFSQFLKEAINEVNKQQIESDLLTTKLAKGENVDLHNVMIASQKASVSLQLAIEVRNKVIEAYQEVMRMQV